MAPSYLLRWGRRALDESNVIEVARRHQKLVDGPVVWSSQIGARACRNANTLNLDVFANYLGGRKAAGNVNPIIVPSQIERAIEVKVLLPAVRDHSAGEGGAQDAPLLVALDPWIDLADFDAARGEQEGGS